MSNAIPYLPRSGSKAETSSCGNTISSSGQSSTSEDDSGVSHKNPIIKLRVVGYNSYYYLSGTPTPDSRSKTDTETSSRVSATSSSEQSSVSEDDSVKSENEPVIKARKTRDTAPYDSMTSASPTVKNTQTEDQKRAQYREARNLPTYQRDTNIKKIETTKQGGAAELPKSSKTDGRWDQFTEDLTADGKLDLFSLSENDISELVAWVRTSPVPLRELSLHNCHINAANAKKLAEALHGNTTLTMLTLDNVIGSIDRAALADALKVNKTLTTLDLQHNKLGAKGAQAVASALRINKTLTTLNLGDNDIGDVGAEALASRLRGNTTLTTLEIQDNEISIDGAEALVRALRGNTTLTTLDLCENDFELDDVSSLNTALQDIPTLATLILEDEVIQRSSLAQFDLQARPSGSDQS